MNRRDTLAALVAICTAPSALAQPVPKAPRIALVDTAEQIANMVEGRHPYWGSLLSELRQLGYVEGKSITIERWSGAGDSGGYRELARKVAASHPRIIVARGRTTTLPLAAATSEIPIVSIGTISSELSTSLARPSGNVTGLSTAADAQQIFSKQLEFLRELTKAGARVAWMGPQLLWEGPIGEAARHGARQSTLVLQPVFVASPVNADAISRAFVAVRSGKFDGLLISSATELFPLRAEIARIALEARLPSMANGSHYVDAGILASYATPTDDLYRRAAHYVDKILKGAKPGDLPIELPGKIPLVLNRKTAKALRITIPQSLLLRADRVIE
jgi:putative tryptophan/tyrosine transport system substrate-binding protein